MAFPIVGKNPSIGSSSYTLQLKKGPFFVRASYLHTLSYNQLSNFNAARNRVREINDDAHHDFSCFTLRVHTLLVAHPLKLLSRLCQTCLVPAWCFFLSHDRSIGGTEWNKLILALYVRRRNFKGLIPSYVCTIAISAITMH